MKFIFRCAALIVSLHFGFAQEAVDTSMMSKIRDEGWNRSQAKELLSWMTDVYGPRLTGSPEYTAAAEWAKKTFSDMGLENSHLEPWGPFGRGWRLKKYSAHLIGRQVQPLVSYPKAWTPGFGSREIEAEVVYLDADSVDQLAAYKGTLKGKFVLVGKPSSMGAYFTPLASRYSDSSLLRMANADVPQAGDRRAARRARSASRSALLHLAYERWQLLMNEKVAAVLTSMPTQRNEGGSVSAMGATVPMHPDTPYTSPYRVFAYQSKAPKNLPAQIELGNEAFNRIVRMIQKGEKVKVAMQLDVEWTSQKDEMSYNVIAEIPGSDLKDEVVMIGAHLDSWHGGQGATDNGTGSASVMEAMRILKTVGAAPRRTIRAALWGGEEQGLLGAEAYVEKHFGKKDALTPAAEKFSAYFNNDNGTGKVRGIYMQGNETLRSIFRSWLKPFNDLGASTVTPSSTGGTDHQAFDAVGLPGFQFIQDPIEYDTRTWHTTMDVWERALEDDMKQAAILMAAFAYNAAMRDEKFPRKEPSPRATGAGYDEEWDCGHQHNEE